MTQMYFSASRKCFCPDDIYGTKTILVPDPSWVPTEGDLAATAPLVEAPNPDCILPADAVPVTMDTYNAVHAELANGKLLSADADGNPISVEPPAIPLATLQSNACNQIDTLAGNVRAKYITTVPGQEAVYQMKLDEAKAFQSDTNPQAANYPHLNAEATETNSTMAAVAQLVINTYNLWVPLSAKIEGYRRGGNVTVNAATDAVGVQAALTTALANLGGC